MKSLTLFLVLRPAPALAAPVAIAAAVLIGSPSFPQDAQAAGPNPPSILLHHPADVLPVRMALESAHRKLGKASCQQILDDFRDAEGLTLRANLDSLGLGPGEYLALIVYRDGVDLQSGRCRSAGAAAVTHPGDRVVYLCGENFRAQSPGTRANTLIHEMLHSLGLKENPRAPTRSTGRCGNAVGPELAGGAGTARGRSFADVTTATGTGHRQKGHGVAFADLDGDGNQGVYANIGGFVPGDAYQKVVFHNRAIPGTTGSACASSESRATGRRSPDPRGRGRARRIKSVEVYWPASRTRQFFTDVPLDRVIEIRELEKTLSATPRN